MATQKLSLPSHGRALVAKCTCFHDECSCISAKCLMLIAGHFAVVIRSKRYHTSMESASSFILQLAILIISVVVHEVSHGFAALALGDKTAKYAGRLTLNPIPHIDPFGSIILPLLLAIPLLFGQSTILLGWAKPVPYNPHNLRNPRWGPAFVGVAGPLANLCIAIVFRFGGVIPELVSGFAQSMLEVFSVIVIINLVLAVFNLVPIPPLDGSKVLFSALPYRYYGVQRFLEERSLILLLFFVFFLSRFLSPLVFILYYLIVRWTW